MSRTKPDIVADIDPITDFHVLLTRLGAPKRGLEKHAQDALVLAMIHLGGTLNNIQHTMGKYDYKTKSDTVSFENETYTEMFGTLHEMPWRCVEAREMDPPYRKTTSVPLSEALRAVAPVVLLLKHAHFSLANAEDARRWGDVLAAITVFEAAYEEHTGEAFGIAVAIRALSNAR